MVRVTLSPEDSHVAPAFDDLGGLQGLRSPRGLAYDSARAQLYITDVSAAGMGGACTHQCKQCKRSCRHAAARLTRGDLCRCTACVFVCVCVCVHTCMLAHTPVLLASRQALAQWVVGIVERLVWGLEVRVRGRVSG